MHNDRLEKARQKHRAFEALSVWAVFLLSVVIINGTVPFIFGADLHAWTASTEKAILFNLIIYGLIFLGVPLLITRGWATVSDPQFLLPFTVVLASFSMRPFIEPLAALAIPGLVYLHWRFNLADLGIRPFVWMGDSVALLLVAGITAASALLKPGPFSFALDAALRAGADRLLANPASTVEYIFYFGFLAERLQYVAGKWLTPALIAGMYILHEMSNPEYWYGSSNFAGEAAGIMLLTAIYLWRRNLLPIWLGDGAGRFIRTLCG